MAVPSSGMTEGELLEALMMSLTHEQCFMLGEIMGIMSKGDRMHIARLEKKLNWSDRMRIGWRNRYEELRKRVEEEQEGVGKD